MALVGQDSWTRLVAFLSAMLSVVGGKRASNTGTPRGWGIEPHVGPQKDQQVGSVGIRTSYSPEGISGDRAGLRGTLGAPSFPQLWTGSLWLRVAEKMVCRAGRVAEPGHSLDHLWGLGSGCCRVCLVMLLKLLRNPKRTPGGQALPGRTTWVSARLGAPMLAWFSHPQHTLCP